MFFFTSFVFWVPLFGKIIALGHLWFLWNLFLYSLLCVPIFHIVQKYAEGNLATALRSTFTMKAGLGIFVLFPTLLSITELLFKPWFPDSLVLAMSGFGISYSFCLATSVSFQEINTMNFSIRIEN